jgi:hypothetical protein
MMSKSWSVMVEYIVKADSEDEAWEKWMSKEDIMSQETVDMVEIEEGLM